MKRELCKLSTNGSRNRVDGGCVLMSLLLLVLCSAVPGKQGQPPPIVVVRSLSHVQLFEPPWTAARQASLLFTISWSLLKLMSIESVMPSNHLILCCPLLLLLSIAASMKIL